jgi:3-hydroxyanthranilate 3,4-dioxygenase
MGSEKIELHPGDMLHIRQNAAFSVRSDASMGAIEAKEKAGKSFTDGLLWCDNCNHKLHEVYFELNNIEKTSCLTLKTSTSH